MSSCAACSSRATTWIFAGDYKWGTAAYCLCRKCLNSHKDQLWRFRTGSKNWFYERSWIYRFKNPHHLNLFTDEEVINLGGSFPSFEWTPTVEQKLVMDEKVSKYLEEQEKEYQLQKERKRKRVDTETSIAAKKTSIAAKKPSVATVSAGDVFRRGDCCSLMVVCVTKTGKSCDVISVKWSLEESVEHPDQVVLISFYYFLS